MKQKNDALTTSLITAFLLGVLSLPLLSREDQTARTGKKGVITLSTEMRAGDVWLQPGSYQVQEIAHYMVFRKMLKGSDGRFKGPGKEVARIESKDESLGSKLEHTEMHTSLDPVGQRIITKIEIKGENVTHTLGTSL